MATPPTQEQKDIIEIKHDIGRLRNHFEVYKTDVADVKDSLKEIRILLGGTSLNDKKGFISLIEKLEQKSDEFERKIEKHENSLSQLKFWTLRGVGVIFITIGLVIKKTFNL